MLDNNPIFSEDNIKRLAGYISDKEWTLRYDANDTEDQYDAADKLALAKYFMALLADHFFDYFPANYFLNEESRQGYADFVSDVKQDPKEVLEVTIGLLADGFDEIDYIEYDEDELYRKPKRDLAIEEEIEKFLVEIHENLNEFIERLMSPKREHGRPRPSEKQIRGLIDALSKIQENMSRMYGSGQHSIQVFQFNQMIDGFKMPLYCAWQLYKYGWHTDFMKEGDSLLPYMMFESRAQEMLAELIDVLRSESPFRTIERNNVITDGLLSVYSQTLSDLKSGKIIIR